MDYVLETTVNKYGKEVQTPRRIGLAPISSDDIEYEFSVVFDIDRANHMATATKDRTAMFGNKSIYLTPQIGKQLKKWLNIGANASNSVTEPITQDDTVTPMQLPAKTRSRKKEQAPAAPQAPEVPIASHEGNMGAEGINAPDSDQALSPEQQRQIRLYLQSYRIDTIAFLHWAYSKGLIIGDGTDYGIDDIRADQFGYIESLFNHERSRNQFIQHLNAMTKKTA